MYREPTASQRSVVTWSLGPMLPFAVFFNFCFSRAGGQQGQRLRCLGQGGSRGKDCVASGKGAAGAKTALPLAGGQQGQRLRSLWLGGSRGKDYTPSGRGAAGAKTALPRERGQQGQRLRSLWLGGGMNAR